MFLFFSLKRKETFFRCILPSSYFILQFCLLSFFVILVLYKGKHRDFSSLALF